MERVAAMGVMLLVVLLLGSCRKDRSDVTPPAASSSPSSTAQEETAIRPEVETPQAAPRVLSESQATAVKLANDVLMWLERYRATFVDGSLATHRAFYDTDHFVEIRLTPDGPQRRTWKELERERTLLVTAPRHAASVAFFNPQLLDWQGVAGGDGKGQNAQMVRLYFGRHVRYLSQEVDRNPANDIDELAQVTMTVKRWHEGPGGFRIVSTQLADAGERKPVHVDWAAAFEPSEEVLQEVIWAPRMAVCEPKRSDCERPGELLLLTTAERVRVLSIGATYGDRFDYDERSGWHLRRDDEGELGWGVTQAGLFELGARLSSRGRFSVEQTVQFAPSKAAVALYCVEAGDRSMRPCHPAQPELLPQVTGQAELEAERTYAAHELEREAKAFMKRWFDARQLGDAEAYTALYDTELCASGVSESPPTPVVDGRWIPGSLKTSPINTSVTSINVLVELPEHALVLARRGEELKIVSGCEWQEASAASNAARPGIDFALVLQHVGRSFAVLQHDPTLQSALDAVKGGKLEAAHAFSAVNPSAVAKPLQWVTRGVQMVTADGTSCDGKFLGFGVLVRETDIDGSFDHTLVAEIDAPCVASVAVPLGQRISTWDSDTPTPALKHLALSRYRSSPTYARLQALVGEGRVERGHWDALDFPPARVSVFRGVQRSFVLVSDQQGNRCEGDYVNLWALYELSGQRLQARGEVSDEAVGHPKPAFSPYMVADVNADGLPELFASFRAATPTERGYDIVEDVDSHYGPVCCR